MLATDSYRPPPDARATRAAFKTPYRRSDPELVYRVVQSIFENLKRFRRFHPVFRDLDEFSMARDYATAPLHKGARAFFEELGLAR